MHTSYVRGFLVSHRSFTARFILIAFLTSFALVYFAGQAHAASNASAGLINSGQTVMASSSPVAVIGLNLASTTETFTGIRLSITPSAGFSTSTDLAAFATATSSGIAVYRDNKVTGIPGTFDNADLVITLSGVPTWTGATTTLTFAATQTVPVDDAGVNAGNDYFVVIQTKGTAVNAHAVQFNLYPGEISWSIFSPTVSPTALTTNALTIDTTPPTVSSTGPTSGSTGVPISSFPSASFSENMDFSTLTSTNITLVNSTAGNTPVGGAINVQPTGFFMVVSSPPTYASTTITRFAKVASTVFGSFQVAFGNPIFPQGGSYSAPVSGDIVYFQHDTFPPELGLVTNATLTGGTFAVNNFNLFGGQSITKFATASSTGLVNASTVLRPGDLVVTNTTANPTGDRYAWHIVTTSVAVNNSALRLDNATAAPTYASTTTTYFSTITPTATTTVNGSNQLATSTAFALGDMVFASTTANTDNTNGYAWHVVTAAETIATGAAPVTLRLDNGAAAPAFAPNTNIAKLSPGSQGVVNDTTTSFSFGDIMFTKTTANAGSNNAYAFHIVSNGNGGTGGTASTALRLDNSSSNLANNTNYVLTIGTGVKDTAGNSLAAPITASFTTGATGGTDVTPPFVQSSQPQQGNQTFAPNAPLKLTFSVDMASTGAGSVTNTANIGLFADSFGALGSQTSTTNTYVSSTKTLTITPATNLSINTSYILRAATSVQSATGAPLPQEYRLYFKAASTTDTTAPTVLGVFPATGASNVSRSSTIMIGFSKDIDASKITTVTVTLSGGITGIVSYNPQSRSATFAPTTQLAAGTTYTITVTTGVKDLAGNALAINYTSTFTTDSVVDLTAPAVAFSNADNFGVAVSFSEPMKQGGGPNAADNIANYTLESPAGSSIALGGKTVTYDGATKTARISGLSLQSAKDFKMTVANIAQDLAGNGMDTSGTPAKNSAFGTVADSAITGGQLGPGGGPSMSASAQGQNPTRVTPMTRAAGVASNYQVQFLAGTSIPVGGTIVLTFPNGFDVSNASAATAGTQSFCNSDINGPMTGTVTIASLATSTSAGTVTITTGGADTGTNAFLCMDLAGIVNSTIPSSSGYTVDIKTRAVTNLALLETKTSAPFFLGTAGSNILTVHVFHDDVVVNTTKDSGEEIANAVVYLFSPSLGGQSTTTSATGVATFNNLSSGDYQIGLSPSGLSGYAINFAPQPVSVSGNVTKKIILSAAPRTITGTIYGPASTKLDVFATTQNGFAKTTVTTNSTSGTIGGVSYGGSVAYSLGVQNNSTYQVGVGPSVPETTQIPGAPPPPQPTFNFMPPAPLTVAVATTNIAGKDFTLTAAGNSILGTVKDSAGSAVSGAGVFCRPAGNDSAGTSIGFGTGGQTGTNGSFTVKAVPGLYVCGVFKPGMPSVPDQQVNVASGGTQTPASLDFTLGVSNSNLTITGTIKDDGGNAVSYAGVSARKVNSTSDTSLIGGGTSNFVGGPADSNGAYTLYVAAGTWVIEAFAPGFGRLGTKTVTVSSASLTGQDFSAQTLNLGSITGSATQAGSGVQGVMVRAETTDGSSGNMTNTAGDGTFTLKVPAGTYALKCFFPGVGESTPTTGIVVTAGTATPDKNCAIAAPITITVNVTDGTNPIANAFVDVRNSSGFGNSTGVSTTTGANAIYTISVPPGTYSVRVGHSAYGLIGTKTATTTQALTFTTTSGALFPVTGTVTAGSALPNAWVSVIGTPTGQTNTITVGAQTGATGAFSVNVPAGSYKVRASKPGYQSIADTSATVTAATAVGVLTVTASARIIAGTVTLGGSGVSGAYIDATGGGGGFSIAQTDASGAYSLAVGNGTWTLNAHSQGYAGTLGGVVVSGSDVSGKTITLSAISGFTVKPERQENVTPTAGGLLTNPDIGSSFKLNIPANALGTSANAGTVTTQLNTAMPTPQTGAILSKNAVTIGATDSSGQPIKNLNDTVMVVVPYAAADIPSGYSEANLVLGVWNAATQSYDSLPTTLDTTAHTLSASVSHFSDFAPLLPASSNPVAVSTPVAVVAVASSNGSIGSFGGGGIAGATVTVPATTVAGIGAKAPTASPYTRVLQVGVKGTDVTALQAFLVTKGFMRAPSASGRGTFGPLTQRALAAYQKSAGLPVLGIFGPATKKKVESEATVVPAPGNTPATVTASAPASTSSYARALSSGSSGTDVAQLQEFLQAKGLLTASLGAGRGRFGPMTQKALMQYQTSIGLEATGTVGPKTRAALNATTATTANTPAQ